MSRAHRTHTATTLTAAARDLQIQATANVYSRCHGSARPALPEGVLRLLDALSGLRARYFRRVKRVKNRERFKWGGETVERLLR